MQVNDECNSSSGMARKWPGRGRPSLAWGRQTGERDLLVLLLGLSVLLMERLHPCWLTERQRWWLHWAGVSGLADDSNSLNSTAKAKPFSVCVSVHVHWNRCGESFMCGAGHTAFACACVSTLCVSFSPDSQEASAASDVAARAAFSPAPSFWLTSLWYYLFIQSHVYKWRPTGILYRTGFPESW